MNRIAMFVLLFNCVIVSSYAKDPALNDSAVFTNNARRVCKTTKIKYPINIAVVSNSECKQIGPLIKEWLRTISFVRVYDTNAVERTDSYYINEVDSRGMPKEIYTLKYECNGALQKDRLLNKIEITNNKSGEVVLIKNIKNDENTDYSWDDAINSIEIELGNAFIIRNSGAEINRVKPLSKVYEKILSSGESIDLRELGDIVQELFPVYKDKKIGKFEFASKVLEKYPGLCSIVK